MKHTSHRKLKLQPGKPLVAPGVHNPLAARLAEQAGFECVFASGHGISAATIGRPDVGLTTLTEMLAVAERIIDSINLPLLVDGDTGYGGLLNVRHTVEEYQRIGAAGIQLEDQNFPKRCGYMDGGGLVTALEMQRRIAVAVEAKKDPDFIIIARTEARMVDHFDDAITRARAYKKAGADWLFVNGLSNLAQLRRTAEELEGPLVYNYSGTGLDPLHRVEDICQAGFQVILFPNLPVRLAAFAMEQLFKEVLRSGDFGKATAGKLYAFDRWKTLTGIDDIVRFEDNLADLIFDD